VAASRPRFFVFSPACVRTKDRIHPTERAWGAAADLERDRLALATLCLARAVRTLEAPAVALHSPVSPGRMHVTAHKGHTGKSAPWRPVPIPHEPVERQLADDMPARHERGWVGARHELLGHRAHKRRVVPVLGRQWDLHLASRTHQPAASIHPSTKTKDAARTPARLPTQTATAMRTHIEKHI
jgi:hypothetical protein